MHNNYNTVIVYNCDSGCGIGWYSWYSYLNHKCLVILRVPVIYDRHHWACTCGPRYKGQLERLGNVILAT